MPDLPSGTLTFLFTDIQSSTRLWEQHPEAMKQALSRHGALVADWAFIYLRKLSGRVIKQRSERKFFQGEVIVR